MENTFYQDLLDCQKEIETIDKDGNNPYFKSKYATLGATISACKAILNSHNILCLQPIESDENGVYVCTSLIHTKSDKSLTTKMRIMSKSDNDPQAQGSAITYARRYSLQSLLFMTADDDDGEGATKHATSSPKPTTSPQTTKPTELCPKHSNPDGSAMVMTQKTRDGKSWFSHQLSDGTWCQKVETGTTEPM